MNTIKVKLLDKKMCKPSPTQLYNKKQLKQNIYKYSTAKLQAAIALYILVSTAYSSALC